MSSGGVTDSGLSWAADASRVAAIAVAVVNTAAAIEIASRQEELAKSYLSIAKEQNQYYYDVYVPCEDAELEEACSATPYEKNTESQVGRMITSVRHQFAGQPDKALQCISRYCTGKQAMVIKDHLVAEATAVALSANLGRRYEEQFAEAQDDLRWARRSEALSRGRGMMAQAVGFAGFAYGIFGRLGEQAGRGAVGAVRYLGYANNRNDTIYPTRTTTSRPVGSVYVPEVPEVTLPTPTPKAKPPKILG